MSMTSSQQGKRENKGEIRDPEWEKSKEVFEEGPGETPEDGTNRWMT